jgi:hypothetical protein
MRFWPRRWFHIHRWEKLLEWMPVWSTNPLYTDPNFLVGVRCRDAWCHQLSLERLQGSYHIEWSRSQAVTYEEAMERLARAAEEAT